MKGLLIPTARFILAVLILSVLVGGIVYFMVRPFNKMGFYLTGKIEDPFVTMAQSELSTLNSTTAKIIMNMTAEETRFSKKVVEARRNDEVFWAIAPMLFFLGAYLFYTGITGLQKGGANK